MRKCVVALLTFLLVLPATPVAYADAYHARPKLVVILVIDQLRGDLLERKRDDFTTANGFNLFFKRGAYFSGCYYDYNNTKTAPGHATIGTGAYTDGHGIGSNEWWDLGRNTDRVISSVEDERYRLVGTFDDLPVPPPGVIPPAAPRIGSSPINLRASTLGDEVRMATHGEAKLYGVSLKDRASILPAGQTANGAFWIDQATGRFVTSTYYMKELPGWATAFNRGPRIAQAVKESGLDETTQFYSLVGRTPAANSYELDFAKTLIENEKLGQGKVTDVISVSLSANDILGHQLGPDSDAQHEMLLGLDRDLNTFFTALDKSVGLANVTVAFTADHGIAPVPRESARLGIASASLDLELLTEDLNKTLNAKFSPGMDVKYFLPTQELPNLALNWPKFPAGVTEREAEQVVVEAMPAAIRRLGGPELPPNNNATPEATRKYLESREDAGPSLYFLRSRVDLAEGKVPNTEFGRRVAHSWSDHGGWYVMVVPTAFQMETFSGIQTTHYSPWSYDRHVPMAFFGVDFVPGYYREAVAPVDIAVTLASVLGVNAPSASVGHVLTQALRRVKVEEAR